LSLRERMVPGVFQVVFVGSTGAVDAENYLRRQALGKQFLAPMPEGLSTRLRGTPTLLLLRPGGRVVASWESRLTQPQETSVITTIATVLSSQE